MWPVLRPLQCACYCAACNGLGTADGAQRLAMQITKLLATVTMQNWLPQQYDHAKLKTRAAGMHTWQITFRQVKQFSRYLCLITSNILSANLLLQANLNTVMLVVPLPEGCSVNLDDSILHQCLCPD